MPCRASWFLGLPSHAQSLELVIGALMFFVMFAHLVPLHLSAKAGTAALLMGTESTKISMESKTNTEPLHQLMT